MSGPTVRLSLRTLTFGLGMAIVVTMLATAIAVIDSEPIQVALSDIGEAAIVLGSAAVVLYVASRFRPGTLRTTWLLVGLGVASFGIGDVIWSVIEVGLKQEVPYPGLPDVFYLIEYPLLATGILLAGLAYRQLVPLKRSAILAALMAIGMAILLWTFFISPYIVAGEWNAESILSTVYPMADVLLLLGPAIFSILVMANLAGGRLGWPWWVVGLGAVALAAADTGYSWLSAIDAYHPGLIVDYGWMISHAAFAFGALVADDLANPVRVAFPAEKPAASSAA